MRRRRPVEPRRVIFIGVEGESERAFAQFLQRCCDSEGRHLHLIINSPWQNSAARQNRPAVARKRLGSARFRRFRRLHDTFLGRDTARPDAAPLLPRPVKPGGGGDSVSVVEEAGRHLARHSAKRDISDKLVLLDRDRIEQDLKAGRDAQAAASGWNLKMLFQDPNLEGLLFRLRPGHEQRRIMAGDAMAELRKVWPEYRKPPTADQLSRRFTLSDVRRAARYDEELQKLLTVLGFEPHRKTRK